MGTIIPLPWQHSGQGGRAALAPPLPSPTPVVPWSCWDVPKAVTAASLPVWDPAWATQGSGESGADLGWVNTDPGSSLGRGWGQSGLDYLEQNGFCFFSSLPER